MKTYVKPMIEFIELKPEERLACVTGGKTSSGCCGKNGGKDSDKGKSFGWWCPKRFSYSKHCNTRKYYNHHCR